MTARFQSQVSAASLHSMRLSGVAHTVVDLNSFEDLSTVVDYARKSTLHIVPLGEGSNLIFPEQAKILWLRPMFKQVEAVRENDNSVWVTVGAGVRWHDFVSYCLDQRWHGLENLALIPGTVGAAPIQNIGAYGVEVDSFIDSVQSITIDSRAEVITRSVDECGFSYRDSIFKRSLKDKELVTAVCFRLQKSFTPNLSYAALNEYLIKQGLSDEPTAQQVFSAVVAIRQQRLPNPSTTPNAGSFFKNPIVSNDIAQTLKNAYIALPAHDVGHGMKKLSAAWLIDNAGLKGFAINSIKISAQHALVLVNESSSSEKNKGATAGDVLKVANYVQDRVKEKFGVDLEPEPRMFI